MVCCSALTAARLASATQATNNAYSTRSWPSSSSRNRRSRSATIDRPALAKLATRSRIQLCLYRSKEAADARAEGGHRDDGSERDKRREQRVLDEVLRGVIPDESPIRGCHNSK